MRCCYIQYLWCREKICEIFVKRNDKDNLVDEGVGF
jgi:hypothetical protein